MEEKIEFEPKGVCSKKMIITVDDNIVKNSQVIGGCPGNSLGISALIKDMPIDEVINKLSGIKCGNKPTSCPDQLSRELVKYKEKVKVKSL